MALLHNFKKGIDWVLDPTGATALANHIFISKSGSDATGDGSNPATPYLTPDAADVNGLSKKYIVGTGEYNPVGLIASIVIEGDGLVVFKDNGTNRLFASNSATATDIVIDGYLNLMPAGSPRGNSLVNCVVMNTSITTTLLGNSSPNNCTNCKFINTTISYTDSKESIYDRCLLINSTVSFSGVKDFTVKNSHIDPSSEVTFTNTGVKTFSYNNNQGTLNGVPDVSVGNINLPPLFNGTPSKLEFSVQKTSPLLGGGESGAIIGGVYYGFLQNEDSLQFGDSLDPLGNTFFNSGELQKVIPANVGVRESLQIDLGKIYSSPIITLAGITDFLNNVPYFESITNPSHLNIDVRYAGQNLVFTSYKPFKLGERMYLDDSGNSTGESMFSWDELNDQAMRYIQIRVTLPIAYTQG